jgi:zinc protease
MDAYGRGDDRLPGLEHAILAGISELQRAALPDAALARSRKALRLDWERLRMNRSDLAFTLGHFEVMDSWRTLQAHMEARERATPADLQRLARTYFVPANQVIGTSRRQPSGGSAALSRPETTNAAR